MPDNGAASILQIDDCRQLFERVQSTAHSLGVSDVEMILGQRAEGLTRFANNNIHQNVAEESKWLSVRTLLDGKTARATTNRLDDEGIRAVVAESLALTKATATDPDILPMAKPQQLLHVNRFDPETAETSPHDRAIPVTEAIRLIAAEAQTAAGIYSTEWSGEAIFNSEGISAWHAETMARFSVTAMAGDSSGWAKASSTVRSGLDPSELARRASQKAKASRIPREVPPGKYTVILEPSATLDLLGQLFGDFSGTALADQRSFLNDRLGSKLFGENITISDDVYHPLQAGAPFDGEGVPRRTLQLVEAGMPREVAYSRASAHRHYASPTGHGFPLPNEIGEAPVNIVIGGGETSLEDMIASTGHGILVTRCWYIREVDPYEKIVTGMTRDGTFLIEDGRVTAGIRNFRFNQSLVEMLNHVEALSPTVRASGEESFDMVAPALKVAGFNFTEVTKF